MLDQDDNRELYNANVRRYNKDRLALKKAVLFVNGDDSDVDDSGADDMSEV